jgi:beta-galactosidase
LANRHYFADVFSWTGKEQHVRLSNDAIQARLHQNGSSRVLWVVNSTREPQRAKVSLAPGYGVLKFAKALWAGESARATGNELTVPPRDAVVIRLV